MTPFENLGGDRTHYGGNAVSERALRDDHQIEQQRRRGAAKSDEAEVADHKAEIADHPDPFAPDPIGQMAEGNLTGNRDKAHQTERPSRLVSPEADLDQVFRLMDLDGIPGKQRPEIAGGQPPEAPCAERPPECPIDRRPGMVHDVLGAIGRSSTRNQPIRAKAHILRASPEQQVQRSQEHQQKDAEPNACGTPSRRVDQPCEPGQDRDRAGPDPRERDAKRKSASADKPVRQVKGLYSVGETVDPAPGEYAEREIKLPRFADNRRQDQARPHRDYAKLDDNSRPSQVRQPTDKRGDDRRDEEPERERTGGDAAIPTEFVEDGREQQGEGRAGIDPDRHRDEGDRDKKPAIEERQPHPATD